MTKITLVALYCYNNFPVRIMHSLLDDLDDVQPNTIFFKDIAANETKVPTKKEEELFIDKLVELKPEVVGLSVLSPFVPIAKRLTNLIKNRLETLVVWGGIHPTLFPQECINEMGVDVVCIGEGDEVIKELAVCVKDGRSFNHIKNLWIKNSNGIVKNSIRPLIQELDSLPFPAYGKESFYFIDHNKIHSRDSVFISSSLSSLWIQTSRGCPFSCSYCINSLLIPLFKGLGPIIRRKSVDTIIREIKTLRDLPGSKINYISFIDEVFATKEDWLNEFEQRYKKEIGLPFSVEYNPQLVDLKILRKLVNAGIDTVNFGIQSGSDYIRNTILNRPGKNKDILNLAKEMTALGIKIKYDLIINNPYDDINSLKETISNLLQLPRPLFFNLFSLQYFSSYPLTERALGDKLLDAKRVTTEELFKNATSGWFFVPTFIPFSYKNIYQNIIWLIVRNLVREQIVRYAIFGESLGSKLCLIYLDLKSVLLGALIGEGGIIFKYRIIYCLIEGMRYFSRGEIKTLVYKITRRFQILKRMRG